MQNGFNVNWLFEYFGTLSSEFSTFHFNECITFLKEILDGSLSLTQQHKTV